MTLEDALRRRVAQHSATPKDKAFAEDFAQKLKLILQGHPPFEVIDVLPVDSVVRDTAILPLTVVTFWAILQRPEPDPQFPDPDQVLSQLEPCLNSAFGNDVRREIGCIELPSDRIRYARLVPVFRSRLPNSHDELLTDDGEGLGYSVPDRTGRSGWLSAHLGMLNQELHNLEARSGGSRGTLRPLVRLFKLWNKGLPSPNLSRYHLEVMVSRLPSLPVDSLLSGFEAGLVELSNAILEPCPDPEIEGRFADHSVTPHIMERHSRLMRHHAHEVAQARQLERQGQSEDAHALLGRILGDTYPLKPPAKRPVLLQLNAWGELDMLELKRVLAERTPEQTIRWKEDGGGPPLPPPGTLTGPFPWEQSGLAVRRIAARAEDLRRREAGTLELLVGGLAPLPLFVQLGLELSPWSGPVRLLNRRKDGQWDSISLGQGVGPILAEQEEDSSRRDAQDGPPPLFDVIAGLQKAKPSEASGRVVIFISTVGGNVPRDLFTKHLETRQQTLAGLVEIRSLFAAILTEANAGDAFNQLASTLSSLRNAYPNATGFSVVVAGPSTLAFLVGRALNPTILGALEVWNFDGGKYVLALQLPFQGGVTAGPSLALRQLELTGFRGFAKSSIPLSARCIVLSGTNGAGKSSILYAMTLMLSALAKGWGGGRWSPSLTPADIHRPGAHQTTLRLTVELEQKNVAWQLDYAPNKLRSDIEPLRRELQAIRQQYPGDDALNLPIMVYYPVQRAIPEASFRSRGEKHGEIPGLSQFAAWEGGLGEGESNFRAFFQWFKEREDLENKRKVSNAHYQDAQLNAVRRAISALLPGFSRPSIERNPLRMEIFKGDVAYDVRQLSDGEKITLALTADLARRLTVANPGLTDPLQGSGVVLIDEVELHLHPGWQRKIVPRLMETFPRCQFILTTHSPQVLGELKNAQVLKLARARGLHAGSGAGTADTDFSPGMGSTLQVEEISAPYGWDSNLILELYMDSDARTADVKERLKYLRDLIGREEAVAARAVYDALAQNIGRDSPDMVGAEVRLRWLEVARR